MRIYFSLIMSLCIGMNFLQAQILSPSTTGSAGRSVIVGNIYLEDHIGSTWSSTISTPTFMNTQGFLQPDQGTTSVVPPINDILLIGGNYTLDALGSTVENAEENALVEFSLGELVSMTLSTPQNMLTQGILQPFGKHWTGLINTSWTNTGNWSPPFIPTDKDDVTIPPNCPNYPIINNGVNGFCNHLLLMYGSSLTVNSGGSLSPFY